LLLVAFLLAVGVIPPVIDVVVSAVVIATLLAYTCTARIGRDTRLGDDEKILE